MRPEQVLDQRNALYRLAGKIDWALVEERFGGLYVEEGRPGIPIRLMEGLHYLKHAFTESDEAKKMGIDLRQSYERVSKLALAKDGRYTHARQMKRAKRELKQIKTYLGRVIRYL